jgi:hypothetical protein
MYPFYFLAVTGLTALRKLLARRAARLERKYTAAALEAETLAKQMQTRPGNASHADVLTTARRQYEIGRLVQNRDRLETRYAVWQNRADRAAKLENRLANWKGRTVPYLLGVADVILVLFALGRAGVPIGLTPEKVEEAVKAYASR